MAVANDVRTIAFPAISCGIYGYPIEEAAEIAIAETQAVLAKDTGIEQVIFALFDEAAVAAYRRLLGRVTPPAP